MKGTINRGKSSVLSPSQVRKIARKKHMPLPGSGPQFKLMLHNDIVNRNVYVTNILHVTLVDMTREEAMSKMQEAHQTGKSLLRIYPQQTAVEYCDQLRHHGLQSTVEPIEY
jgi:ATP-dependent Clp protease adapter protein ClpS